jgi:hypothetical protein
MPKANHAHITSRRRALVALSTGLAAVNVLAGGAAVGVVYARPAALPGAQAAI